MKLNWGKKVEPEYDIAQILTYQSYYKLSSVDSDITAVICLLSSVDGDIIAVVCELSSGDSNIIAVISYLQ